MDYLIHVELLAIIIILLWQRWQPAIDYERIAQSIASDIIGRIDGPDNVAAVASALYLKMCQATGLPERKKGDVTRRVLDIIKGTAVTSPVSIF